MKIALAALSILFGFTWAFLFFFGNQILKSVLVTTFEKSTQGRYTFSFEEIGINITAKGFTIKNIQIKADSSAFLKSPNENWITLNSPSVKVSGISFFGILFENKTEITSIHIDTPTLFISKGIASPIKKDSLKTKEDIRFTVHNLSVSDARFLMKENATGQFIFKADSCNLLAEDFSITGDFSPVYRYFSFDSQNTAVAVFGGNELKIGRLYLTGSQAYTGLIASELDLTEIEKPLRENLKIPDEIDFSFQGISIQSESLAELAEQLKSENSGKLKVSRLLLLSPIFILSTDSDVEVSTEPAYKIEKVAEKINFPQIGKIGLVNGTLIWKEKHFRKPVLRASGITAMANDISPQANLNVPFLFSSAEMFGDSLEYTPPGSEYSFAFSSWKYRSATDSLTIMGFNVYPHKSLEEYYIGKKWREDRLEFTSERIDFENLNLLNYVIRGKFSPDLVLFSNPSITAYTDKRLNHDPSVIKPYPLQKIREIDGNFDINTIRFENGKITYSEKVPNSPGIGTLKVNSVNLSIHNLKSHPELNDSLTLLFEGSFGDSSVAKLKMDLPLYGDDEIQHIQGSIKNLNFKRLNSITENTVLLGFTGGTLDSCQFSFYANNGVSVGRSYFYYRNLKVKIYKVMEVPSYNSTVLMNKTFLSLAANFLINKSNPTEEGYSYPGQIAFKRDMLKGPINFWVKSIMTGLMNTVIDDISELSDLQDEIKGLKADSEKGMWGKLKSENQRKKEARKKRFREN
ncbi:MAG: hypothetical protein MH137_02990 [Flavobacteriales bacterium]|nr:hypothetical protein [Flavobacteriales bacterium]